MINCFVCSFKFQNPQKLCEHLKSKHQLSGQNTYKCTICRQELTELWKYRRHLDMCHVESSYRPQSVAPDLADDGQTNLLNFESRIQQSALEFVCKLAGNMSIPRNYVFEMLNDFNIFYSTMITEGFNQYVDPFVCKDNQVNLKYLLSIFQDPFKNVNSEYKLDSTLLALDLISPSLKKVEFINIDNEWHDSADCELDEENKSIKESVIVMPLEFQFRKFFELPNVFKMTQKYAKEVSDQNLGHFINGEVWKKKLESFKEDDIVIPFHLHTDDVQINNALGAHRRSGLETCTYYSFPTVPPEYNSRLQNIFVAQLFSSNTNKKIGNYCCFKNMIHTLNEFGQKGITLNIDGEELKVYFVLGLTLGDNKGVNDMCGFARSHRANYFCRFCKMHRVQTETATLQNNKMMRNVKNYADDVAKKDFPNTGITEESIVNLCYLCHATNSIGADTMHDILEGLLHYNMCEIILYFIEEGYFSLDQLNRIKFDLSYGETESNNKSAPIEKKRLQAGKLLMSASEMDTFARHFVFMVGNLVPESDPVWKFYLKTMKFVELMDLTSYTKKNFRDLKKTISQMNTMYVTLFKTNLKPKHHLVTHYPTLIKRYGPLRFISSMRFESKHRIMKNYTKNTVSRVNMSYSLGRKLQYNFASCLLENTGLTDNVSYVSSKFIQLEHSDIFQELEKSEELDGILKKNLKETRKFKINGITFSTNLSIPVKQNSELVLFKIVKIVYATEKSSDTYLICEEYKDVLYNDSYGCYEVDFSNPTRELKLISVASALNERQCTISTHVMEDNVHRFRMKSL